MPVLLHALIIAVLLDLLLGDPPNRFHPVAAMGSLIRWAARWAGEGWPRRRFLLGTGFVLLGGAIFSLPWLSVPALLSGMPPLVQGIVLAVLLKPTFALRRLLEAGMEIRNALGQADLAEARRLLAWHLVSRPTTGLSEGQIASAVIESLVENLADSFFAPLLAFTIGGLPLAWFYRFVNTADAMIGYHTPQFEYFGKFAARLDDSLNWLPARLAALFLVIGAWICGLNGIQAWQVMVEQHRRTSSPNAGWSMAPAAGALGVRLEKPGHYRVEGGDELPSGSDIRRTTQMVLAAAFFCLLFCGGMIYGRGIII